MNIGNCCICLGNFSPAQMAVLGCLHSFHRNCITRAMERRMRDREQPECPLCRAQTSLDRIITPSFALEPLPADFSKQAMNIAMGYYRKIVKNPVEGATDEERERLQNCLLGLMSTIEDQQLEQEERWDELIQFIRVAGIASLCAILAFLCFLYWPVIAPIASGLAGALWSLVRTLKDFVSRYFPELVTGIMGMLLVAEIASDESGGGGEGGGPTSRANNPPMVAGEEE